MFSGQKRVGASVAVKLISDLFANVGFELIGYLIARQDTKRLTFVFGQIRKQIVDRTSECFCYQRQKDHIGCGFCRLPFGNGLECHARLFGKFLLRQPVLLAEGLDILCQCRACKIHDWISLHVGMLIIAYNACACNRQKGDYFRPLVENSLHLQSINGKYSFPYVLRNAFSSLRNERSVLFCIQSSGML